MRDDGLIDLLHTAPSPESGDGEAQSELDQRSSGAAFLILLLFLIPLGLLFGFLMKYPRGLQFASMMAYTFAIPYIASNRFLRSVPWTRLTRPGFLLLHSLALAAVYGIITGFAVVKPHLPVWFVGAGRKGALSDYCLVGILLAIAFWECSWASRHDDDKASETA